MVFRLAVALHAPQAALIGDTIHPTLLGRIVLSDYLVDQLARAQELDAAQEEVGGREKQG